MSSRILVIGGTGTMGQHLARASLAAGHPTALLVRPATAADPGKLKLLEDLKGSGATIVNVCMYLYSTSPSYHIIISDNLIMHACKAT